MKKFGLYIKIEWSEEDRCYIGYCPALFDGGVCHDTDFNKVSETLDEIISSEIEYRKQKCIPILDFS